MRRPSEEISVLKNDILDTAIAVFSEKGYSATSVQDVADALNISRSPIYYHFKNKTALYEQAVLRYLSNKRDLYTSIDTQDESFFTILRQHIMQGIKNTVSEPILFGAINNGHFPELSAARKETGQYIRLLKKVLITHAIHSGELRSDLDIDKMIDHIYILFYGFSVARDKAPDGIEIEDLESLLNYIIISLKESYSPR